jgi:hypothetical protein
MDLEVAISQTSYNVLIAASIILAILVTISLRTKHPTAHLKKFLFLSICTFVMLPTLYMSIATIYLNTVSASSGPVHWHADIEIWNCGEEVNLKDPVGMLSNKIGTATLHEHNDKRIHLEGVVVKSGDSSLGKFFRVIGGEITPTSVTVPTNSGQLPLTNGSTCHDGQAGQVQTFVYKVDKDNYYTQKKIENPQDYNISPQSNVPPGDCIIVEFGPVKDKTDKLCRSYVVANEIGKLKGERPNGY